RPPVAVGWEGACPYRDPRVVEFAARLPLSMKLRNGGGKWILRRLLDRYVPQELIDRPKKGFSLPIAEWLRGFLREWAEELLGESRMKHDGYFHPKIVRKVWEDHVSGRRDFRHHVWALLMFQAWLDDRDSQKPRSIPLPSLVGSQQVRSSLLN